MLAGPTEIVVTSERGRRGRHRLRPRRAGRARSRSARHLHHHARRSRQRSHRRRQSCAAATIPSRASRSTATAWSSSQPTLDEARAITNRLAPEHLTVDSARDLDWVAKCRLGLRRPLVGAAHGRLHLRPQSHAAHRRHGARARRPQRQRLRQAHHRAGVLRARRRARSGPRPRCWPKPKDSSATPKPFARGSTNREVARG